MKQAIYAFLFLVALSGVCCAAEAGDHVSAAGAGRGAGAGGGEECDSRALHEAYYRAREKAEHVLNEKGVDGVLCQLEKLLGKHNAHLCGFDTILFDILFDWDTSEHPLELGALVKLKKEDPTVTDLVSRYTSEVLVEMGGGDEKAFHIRNVRDLFVASCAYTLYRSKSAVVSDGKESRECFLHTFPVLVIPGSEYFFALPLRSALSADAQEVLTHMMYLILETVVRIYNLDPFASPDLEGDAPKSEKIKLLRASLYAFASSMTGPRGEFARSLVALIDSIKH